MEAREVLTRPLLTEKATIARESAREYIFEVDRRANKIEIKRAVEELFDVKVQDVRTACVRGKVKRMGAHEGKRRDWKKAMVTLVEGNTIEMFEQM